MIIPLEDKFYIAAKSAFINERLNGAVIPKPGESSDSEKIMERWQRMLNGKDTADSFEKRIKLTGMTSSGILPFIGPVDWNPAQPLPEWVTVLEEVFSYIPIEKAYAASLLPEGVFSKSDELPFEDYWLPWLLCAARKIEAANPDLHRYFSEKAYAEWLRGVLSTLTKKMTLPLLSAFDMTRNKNFFFAPGNAALSAEPGSKALYLEFVDNMLSGGMLDFAKKYSVAARLSCLMLKNSVDYFNSVMESIRSDMKELADTFNNGIGPGVINGLKANLSDPHNQGRAVIEFQFEKGLKLIYKPRSFDVDKRWEKFLRWCTGLCPEIDFKYPRHVGENNHVWVECLENAPLDALKDAGPFYRRCGALLAAAYALNGYDFHQENLMAVGQYPVLIDLETVLRPLVRPFNYDELDAKYKEAMLDLEGDSVLRTSFLPMWMPVSKDVVRDYGALTPDDNVSYTIAEYLDINTDRMRRGVVERRTEPSPNVPHFNGMLMNVQDHMKELLDGFTRFYKLLMDNSAKAPIDIFNGAFLRYLPRNSQIYGDMIYRLMSPSLLRDGAVFSVEIEGMGQPFINGVPIAKLPEIWKIFEMERGALEILNIPLFEAHAENTAVFENSMPILDDYYLLSAVDEIKRHMGKLSAKDMEFQSQLISASLACRYPKSENDTDEEAEKILAESLKAPLLSDENFIAAAAEIAAEIAEKVIRKDKNPQWLTQKFDPVSHFLNIGPVDAMLYEGAAGIGLFLSAYYHITGDDKYRGLTRECFGSLKDIIENENIKTAAKWISTGYASGIFGALWALRLSSEFLGGDKDLNDMLAKAFDVFSEDAIQNDEGLDILAGSAGGLVTLLEFYGAFKDKRFLDWAVKCGEHLLEKRNGFEDKLLWQSSFAYRPLCGFGHGLAGYAYALLKLFAVTKDERFHDAALKAIDYETAAYMPDVHNWPDFRSNGKLKDGEVALMAGWCSGAPGIGMGRLMSLNIMDNEQVRNDIENALLNVREFVFRPYSPDHICCGFAGRVDFLIEASLRLNRPELMQEARRQLSFVINRAHKRGFYSFGGGSGAIFSPGFFSGISGIAYTALRIVKPQALPTIQLPSEIK